MIGDNIVESVEELKEICSESYVDCYIKLGVVRSSKRIHWDGKYFYIVNEIDDTEQEVTESQLKKQTNIVEAIEKQCLILY